MLCLDGKIECRCYFYAPCFAINIYCTKLNGLKKELEPKVYLNCFWE